MAIQTGAIKYRGSFKSIRNYMTLYDPNTYAGEKGGANRDLIMNNPAFARTRENMSEFGGCGLAVKALRLGFLNLLPEQSDKGFTGRLMGVVKEINLHDIEGLRGKRSIIFSSAKPILAKIKFNKRESLIDSFDTQVTFTHPVGRIDATLKMTELSIKPVLVPKGATHFRIQNYLSTISDYSYAELSKSYEPVDSFNAKSASKYSEYTKVEEALTAELKAEYPVGTIMGEDCTVIQSVGIEFYTCKDGIHYSPLQCSSYKVVDVF